MYIRVYIRILLFCRINFDYKLIRNSFTQLKKKEESDGGRRLKNSLSVIRCILIRRFSRLNLIPLIAFVGG